MNKLFAVLLTVLTISLFANEKPYEVSKALTSFNQVKVYSGVNVKLIKSDENKIISYGKHADDVVSKIAGGVLKIRMELEDVFDGKKTNIEVHYKDDLNLIDANQNSNVTIVDRMDNNYVKLKVQEGANISGEVNTLYLYVKAVTGGKINLNGEAEEQEVIIRAGGIYEGKEVGTNFSDVTVLAGGRADVTAEDKVSANVTAGGKINIHGNPKSVERENTLGGDITVLK